MLVLLLLFLTSFLMFMKNVFFLGFSLLFLSCFMVMYMWKFISQWMGLIFFLVYITGVIVIFIFFCSFSNSTSGLFFSPFYSILFFICLGASNFKFFYIGDFSNLSEASQFYSMDELGQIFLLGFWLIFVLWSSLKVLNIIGGVVR